VGIGLLESVPSYMNFPSDDPLYQGNQWNEQVQNPVLAAADVVLALRFPSFGEMSGALVRAMGVGRPVLVTDGTPPADVGQALITEIDRIRREGISEAELVKAKAQLRARLVFDNDSVTNIAHQLGYFETIASVDLFTALPARIAAATVEQASAAAAAVFVPSNRTIGLFVPTEVGNGKSEVGSQKSDQ